MASWLRALLPAVPVILEAAREARRLREPAGAAPAAADGQGLETALARTNDALEQVCAELKRVQSLQAALERRLDVLAVVTWVVVGVLAVVVIGLLARLATG